MLLGSALGVAGIWAWQDHRHANRLSFTGYTMPALGETPFFANLTALQASQTVRAGAPTLSFFARLEFDRQERAGRQITRLAARPLVPEDTWFDLYLRRTDAGRVVFRLSRCLDVASGWYVFAGPRCVAHEPVDTRALLSPGAGPEPRRRADLKNFTVWYLNQARETVDAEFRSQWIELSLGVLGTSLAIDVNGERLSAFDLATLATPELWAEGAAGVQGMDLPPVAVDWMTLEGFEADGAAFRDHVTFDPAPLGSGGATVLVARRLAVIAPVALAVWALLVFLVPGAGAFALAGGLSLGMALMAGLTVWSEWRELISLSGVISWWRTGQWTLLGLTAALLLIRNREQFRFRVERAPAFVREEPRPAGRALVLLGLGTLFSAAAAEFGWNDLRWPVPEPSDEQTFGPSEMSWSPSTPLHQPLAPMGQAALSLTGTWTVHLGDASAEIEMYFAAAKEGPAAMPRWRALRLNREGARLVESRGVAQGPLLATGAGAFSLDVALQRGELAIRLGGQTHAISLPWREAGAIGWTSRAGSGRVETEGATAGTVPRAEIEARSLRAAAHGHWKRFLLAAAATPVAAALALGLLAELAAGPAAGRALRWGGCVAVAAGGLGVGLALIELAGLYRPPLHEWQTAAVFLAPLLLTVALWWFFWLSGAPAMRRSGAASLILVLAAIVLGEALARSSPARWRWQVRAVPGYVSRQFLFSDDSASLMWPFYTNEVEFKGRPCPVMPASPERRVFCLGGSSTWGAGVSGEGETYPRLLEEALIARTGDPAWRVYNGGMPNFTALDDLLRWRREIRARRPEAIVLYVGGNDHIATNRPGVPQREIWEMLQALEEPTLVNRLRARLLDLRLLVGANTVWTALRGGQLGQYAVRLPPEDFEWALRPILEEAREDGVHVVLAPEVIVECLTQPDHSLQPWHETLARLAREFGVPLAPTVEAFRARRRDDIMIDYIHPNAHGNALLAEVIADTLLAGPAD